MFFFLVRPGWDYLVAARRRDVSSVAGKLALRGSFRTSPARAPSVCSSNFHLPFPVLSSPLSLQPSGDSLLSTLSSSAVSSSSCLRHGTRHRFASESRSSLSVFSGLQSPSLKTMQNSSGATPGPQLEFSACASIGRRDGGFAPSGASTADPFVGVTSVQGSHSPQRRSVRFPLCPRSSSLAAPTRRLSALRSSSFSAYFSVPRACAPALRRSLDFHSVSPRNVLHSAEQRRSLVEVKFAQQKGKDTSQVPFKVVRTPSGNLPVYARVRKHGTAVTTIIRHAFGDITAMKKDLMAICEAPVRERCGTLEVKGLHVLKVKQWLRSLGF